MQRCNYQETDHKEDISFQRAQHIDLEVEDAKAELGNF